MENQNIQTRVSDRAYRNEQSIEVIGFECSVPEKEIVIAYTVALQSSSMHPIAASILKFLPQINFFDFKIEKFEDIEGYGIKGFVNGHEIIIGNLALMKIYDFFYDESLNEILDAIIVIIIDDRYCGFFRCKMV